MNSTRTGIGSRIARLVALVTFFAVIIAAMAQSLVQVTRDIENNRTALQVTAFALASAAGDAVVEENQPKAMSALTAVSRIPNILVASIRLQNGKILAQMGQAAYLEQSLMTPDDTALAMLYKGHLPVSVDIVKGGRVHGQLMMLGDISNLRGQLFLTLLSTFAAGLVAAFLGVAASKPLQRRIVGPLTNITTTIQAIRKSRDYSTSLVDDDENYGETGVLTKAFNGLMQDIRFRDQSLQQLAYNDPLTGLSNRVSFQRSVGDWLENKYLHTYGSVVLVNIIGFRTMNDAFSHSIGDALLMTVAATIRSAIQEEVTLARYGGDEFALLMPATVNEVDVEMSFARIQSAFAKPLRIADLELHVNLTAGAVMLSDSSTLDEALRHADLALAEAKNQISGRVQFFEATMAAAVQSDTAMGQALRQAAQSGSFELRYQPQMDLHTNRISGLEALVRWTHPIQGPISPSIFIPLAERIGLVSVIGDWVLAEGCKQAATWLRQGQPERVMSINISPAQILAAGFVEKVRSALRKSGLPPHLLCLELTESIFVGAQYAETVIILETLAKDGIKLALDDFGTGYSSLGYLSKLPFHTIKIDRSFVSHADKNQRKAGMLKSIVEMVHALGMTVVAEGAETQEELALLRKLDVTKVQGYVIARPMPAANALQLANAIDQQGQSISA
jgi:diguanylate cyclase (GGDEF)-like protein